MFVRKNGIVIAVAGSLLGFSALVAPDSHQSLAQATDDLQQGFRKGPGLRVTLTPKNALEISGDETQIFPDLKGIVIVNNPGEVRDAGVSATGVQTSSDVIPAGVIEAAEAYLGQPVSLASLDRLTRDMVLAFRDAGIPVVNVVVPPQDVTNSVIQILAVVGRLGETTVEGATSNPEYYASGFPVAKGEVIEEAAVVNHLRWKSRRQNRRVDAIYSPGASFGETDIALDVTETKPWSVFLGADSSGPGTSGDYRFFGGVVVNDIFTMADELSYQFTTSEDGIDALNSHVLQYTLPVWDRTDFQITGAYVESSAGNAVAGVTDGLSTQLTGTFITQLDEHGGFYWDSRFGFDYKSSDSSFDFGGGITIPGAETEVGQFFGLLEGERVMGRSRTNVFAGIWVSPGDMFSDNTDSDFNAARAGASADYVYARGGIEHRIDFENEWTFAFEAEGQIANERLIASELFYLGGINSVRGFQENVIRGDNGVFASAELYLPSVRWEENGTGVVLRGFGFVDAGAVSVNGSATPNEGDASIAGAGVGLTFATFDSANPGASISGEISYGWKLDDDDLNVNDNHEGQLHFRVVSRF